MFLCYVVPLRLTVMINKETAYLLTYFCYIFK